MNYQRIHVSENLLAEARIIPTDSWQIHIACGLQFTRAIAAGDAAENLGLGLILPSPF
jgi:hypothetical protein